MRLEIALKTNVDDICIDYIEVKLKSGKTVSLNWDTTDYVREDGEYSACYKGVYFDDDYANGRIEELKGFEIDTVGVYSEHEDLDSITITEMEFSDAIGTEQKLYVPEHLLPYTIPAEKIDRT